MKLVIQTQYSENYGSTDKPYWKFKGGETYIVENLNPAQAERILSHGIPTLKALIEYKNSMSEESVIYYRIVEDDTVVCDEWEAPNMLSWENNTWVCRHIELNRDETFMEPIVSKITKFTLGMRGENTDTTVSYEVEGGQVIDIQDIMDYCKKHKQGLTLG